MMTTRRVNPEYDIAIVGCGRWLRRDDQVGLVVARELAHHPLPECRVLATESPATDILDALEGVRLLIVIDAARSGEGHPPGSWARLDYSEHRQQLQLRCRTDTHALSVDLVLATAELLGTLPERTWIYAIVAEDCGYGEDLTPDVAAAVPPVIHAITSDVRKFLVDHGRDALTTQGVRTTRE